MTETEAWAIVEKMVGYLESSMFLALQTQYEEEGKHDVDRLYDRYYEMMNGMFGDYGEAEDVMERMVSGREPKAPNEGKKGER